MKEFTEFQVVDNPRQDNSFIAIFNGKANTIHEGAKYMVILLIFKFIH